MMVSKVLQDDISLRKTMYFKSGMDVVERTSSMPI